MTVDEMRIHHIGYLVRHIEKASEIFIALGYRKISDTVYDKYRGIDIGHL